MRIFEVGGSIRDEMLSRPTKDKDFVCVIDEGGPFTRDAQWGFRLMVDNLEADGFRIFLSTPEFLTVRAHFPSDHPDFGKTTADFVLARKDGPSSDGRRPDFVTVGTLADDLARRDFTVNAMAREVLPGGGRGSLIDMHNGVHDLDHSQLRMVGNPVERLREDALRAVRAIRFAVTKDFHITDALADCLRSSWLPPLLESVSEERIREELIRCFQHDTLMTLDVLAWMPGIRAAVLKPRSLWLKPTLEAR